jgi:hypothetical protein
MGYERLELKILPDSNSVSHYFNVNHCSKRARSDAVFWRPQFIARISDFANIGSSIFRWPVEQGGSRLRDCTRLLHAASIENHKHT